LNKKNLPVLVVIALLAITAALAWIYWPENKDSVEVNYDEKWKMGSDEMEVIKAYQEPCSFCYRGGVAPSINFAFDGVNYTTSRQETNRLFVRPSQVPKNELFANVNETSKTYQKFFVAMKPWGLSPNSYIAAVYVVVDGKSVYYSVDEVYDPGWAYELSLKPENSGKSVAEHGLKPLSMMIYSLVFLMGGFVSGTFGYWATGKIIKNR